MAPRVTPFVVKQFADLLTQWGQRNHNALSTVRLRHDHKIIVHSIEHPAGWRGLLS